jgi:hypothetical protein
MDLPSVRMASAPTTGPGARSRNAYCQPTASARIGTNWMVTTVSRKPTAVCAVSAVPMYRLSATSLSAVEKTPESAMTEAPHTPRNTSSGTHVVENMNGDNRQHAPLTLRAMVAAGARPKRSDAHPPSRHPMTPATPTAANTTMDNCRPAPPPLLPCPARMNIGNHVHSAYSSHMWPK